MSVRAEYTKIEGTKIRRTEIQAILENNLFENGEEEQKLMNERDFLDAIIEIGTM